MAAIQDFLSDIKATLRSVYANLSTEQGDDEGPRAYRKRRKDAMNQIQRLIVRVDTEILKASTETTIVKIKTPDAKPGKEGKTKKETDPLLDVPSFMEGSVRTQQIRNSTVIRLGRLNGFNVEIVCERNRVIFQFGCREIHNVADARRHWMGNISRISGERREHANELIDWVEKICRYRQWNW